MTSATLAGAFAGQSARVYVSAFPSADGATLVGAIKNAKMPDSVVTADTTVNDLPDAQHAIIRTTGDLTFDSVVDLNDAGQNILRNAAAVGLFVVVDYVQTGLKTTGRKGRRFTGSVSIENARDVDNMAMAMVTIKRTGAAPTVTY